MPGANPSWHGPWESALSGNFGKEKNEWACFAKGTKKTKGLPLRTVQANVLPRWGRHRHFGSLLTFRAQAGSPPRGLKAWACRPRTRAHPGSRVWYEEPRKVETCRCWCRNPARQQPRVSTFPHPHPLRNQGQQRHSLSVDRPIPEAQVHAGGQDEESQPHVAPPCHQRPHLHLICKSRGCIYGFCYRGGMACKEARLLLWEPLKPQWAPRHHLCKCFLPASSKSRGAEPGHGGRGRTCLPVAPTERENTGG